MIRIYIADCNHGFFDPEYEEAKKLNVKLITESCTQENIVEKCKGSHIIAVQRLEITGKIIDQIPSCRVVTRYGVGLDNIDCKAMEDRGVAVVNFPGFCTEEVANHTMMAIMLLYRQYPTIQYNSSALSQEWGNPNLIQSIRSAPETTIGIIGLGKIGSAVAKRLKMCEFNVEGYDPYIPQHRWQEIGIKPHNSLESIFSNANIISLHVPLTTETSQFIGRHLLELMPMGSCFINTSRGGVVITDDLIDALWTKLDAVFIDVCDPEPPPEELIKIPNLHISHHCAFYSMDSLEYLKRHVIIDSVKAYEMQSNTNPKTV